MKQVKLYLVKFDKNGKMKNKIYLPNCIIGNEDHQSIIVIAHNGHTFSTNDGIHKT